MLPEDGQEEPVAADILPPTKPSVVTVQGLIKAIALALTIAGLLVSAVLYFEHRFGTAAKERGAMQVELEYLRTDVDDLSQDFSQHQENEAVVIKAIQTNQYALALHMVTWYNASKGRKDPPVAIDEVLPYKITVSPNPGIEIQLPNGETRHVRELTLDQLDYQVPAPPK